MPREHNSIETQKEAYDETPVLLLCDDACDGYLINVGLVSVGSTSRSYSHPLHMTTSPALDDAQMCAVPNVAWAAVKAGHKVTALVDASAVTSVTKGFGWFRRLIGSESAALDRAGLPERERQSLSEQMGVPLEQVPHHHGEYFDFLKNTLGVEIYGNQTMMLLYKIDPSWVASAVTPVSLERVVQLSASADRVIVC